MLLFYIFAVDILQGMLYFVPILVRWRVWPQQEVCIFGCAVEMASSHRDQNSPLTSCGICSLEVLISYSALDTSSPAGRLTCKGIFHLDSSYECSTQAITWPALHTEDKKSHLSFCDFHFHLCFLHSPVSVSLFLSSGNYHQPCQQPCRLEREKSVTLPLKFVIV